MCRDFAFFGQNPARRDCADRENLLHWKKRRLRGKLMAMSGWAEELCSWFELCSEAMLGVQKGKIVFQNSAAVRLLGERRGAELSSLLPCCPESVEEGNFSFSVLWGSRTLMFSGMQQGGLLVLRVQNTESCRGVRVGTGVLGAMRSALYQIQLPAERLLRLLPEQEEDLYGSSLRHACYTMRRLVEDLGDLNELLSGAMKISREAVDLTAIAANLVNTMRCLLDKKHAELEVEGENGCFIEGDPRRLEQILTCLISRALASTPAQGRIRVSVQRKGTWVRMKVEDNGRGIPAQRMGTFFSSNPCEEPDAEGEGLGLALAWELVKLHGGRTMVESRDGQGTRVYLEFPATLNLPLRDGDGDGVGMTDILTEMSGVLTHRAYRNRYMD